MKIYIQTDIEGVAGFCFFENRKDPSYENQCHRERMRRLLTAEVDAAVVAAFDAGATDVLVNDNHGSGYNILFEELDERCRIIHGRNWSGERWLPRLDDSVDALILVGMHAMGDTPTSILPHSRWEINAGALSLSEGSMAAAIAGQYGVPTVFASGDDKVTAELGEKIPGIEVAVVKEALSPFQAVSLMPEAACRAIAEGVIRGIERKDEIEPYVVPGPVRVQLYDSETHAPPLRPMLDEPVEGATLEEAFTAYEKQMPWTDFPVRLPDGFVYP
jgi:D-amino peptidase